MKRLQIFRPGKHTATNGKVYEFGEAQLTAAAAAYDPAVHEAPFVVGHPKMDAPAYGWAKSLSFADGFVQAQPHQVDAAFAELVNAGRFKKISATWYLPDAPANPVPGTLYLRHIGFLGANPPAVKGLRAASFGEGDEGVIEFADMSWTMSANASLWRRLRDWIIGEKGLEAADKVISDWEVAQLERDAVKAETTTQGSTAYAEQQTQEQEAMKTKAELDAEAARIADERKKLETDQAAFAERNTALKVAEATRRKAGLVEFAESLVKAGTLLPAHKDGLVAFMQTQSADATIEFGEGDKKATKSPDAWLREFLTALPKAIEFGERGRGDGAENAPTDAPVIAAQAVEFREAEAKAGREISVTAAVMHVTKAAAKK